MTGEWMAICSPSFYLEYGGWISLYFIKYYSTTQFLRPQSILLLNSLSERNQLNDLECLNTIKFLCLLFMVDNPGHFDSCFMGEKKGDKR